MAMPVTALLVYRRWHASCGGECDGRGGIGGLVGSGLGGGGGGEGLGGGGEGEGGGGEGEGGGGEGKGGGGEGEGGGGDSESQLWSQPRSQLHRPPGLLSRSQHSSQLLLQRSSSSQLSSQLP